MGCPGIELDIHLCATGELVVIHDDDTARVTGKPGKVAELSLTELKALDAGSWKGPSFSGERIPTLDELFSELGSSVYYDVEIKCRSREPTGIEEALAGLIDAHGLSDRVAVSSFNPFPLKYFKAIKPDIPTAIIWMRKEKELPPILRTGAGAWISGCDYLKPDHRVFGHPSVLWLGAGLGRSLVPWTIDDPSLARTLFRRGCAGIITNRPQDMGEFY
jgi:glycerophosphoryl diester phosphodiesterase